MRDKYKTLIIIGIITILLIILIIVLLTSNNRNKPNNLTTINTTSSTSTSSEVVTTSTEEVTTTTSITTSNSTTNTSKQKTTTTKEVITTTSTTAKVVSYSCPDNYNLENNKCVRIVNALLDCPQGYTYYNEEKCISLSQGYEVNENDTCANGYEHIMQLSLFGPNTYYCHPTINKIYVCKEGTLKGTECYITTDAIVK